MSANGTIAYVSKLPDCDFCKRLVSAQNTTTTEILLPRKAEYDFKTKTGQWGFGCFNHWVINRMYRDLGPGKGQRLQVTDAVSPVKQNGES